jgi:hypothetical protein
MAEHEAAKRETADKLRELLQQRTKRALELGLLNDASEGLLPGVILDRGIRKSLLAVSGSIGKIQEGLNTTLTHVVLVNDGRLHILEVLEQSDLAHSETEKSGTLKEMAIALDSLIIKHAPSFIDLLETIILGLKEEE